MSKDSVSRRTLISGLVGAAAVPPASLAVPSIPNKHANLKLFFRIAEFGSVARAMEAGETATAFGGSFLVDDDAGRLIFRERTATGSIETARSLTPASLAKVSAMDGIGFSQGAAPFIQSRRALDKLREIGASVKDTGAVGDFAADDTEALQEIVDYFGARGGKWRLPAGIYRTTAPILLNCILPQAISGQGQRGVYPGQFDPSEATDLAVIVPAHAGRQAFQFVGASAGNGSITIRDLAIATVGSGGPEACFAWDTTDERFLRNFNFQYVSINDFKSAFDVHQSAGSMKQAGLFRAMFCNIHRNEWIARTLDGTQWNGFDFSYNEAGQNGYLPGQGGIGIAGHAVNIVGNCLEGMRDPISVSGAYRGIDIRGNYFEGNVGKALIRLTDVRGPFDIGVQAHAAVDFSKLEHHVLLTRCGHGRCLLPYRADIVHKMAPQPMASSRAGEDLLNNHLTGTVTEGWLRCDSLDAGVNVANPPLCSAMATSPVEVGAREISPINGRPMAVAERSISETGEVRAEYSIMAGVGAWAVMSFLMKRLTDVDPTADPHLTLRAEGRGDAESRDYAVHNFDQWWRNEEWCLITAALRITRPTSVLSAVIFPFGRNPARGLKLRFLNPLFYVTDDPNKIVPFVDQVAAHSVMAPPTRGTWQKGDLLNNANPTASGQGQFLCLESGTPGKWGFA